MFVQIQYLLSKPERQTQDVLREEEATVLRLAILPLAMTPPGKYRLERFPAQRQVQRMLSQMVSGQTVWSIILSD